MANEFETELLGQIPFDPKIRADEDQGITHAFKYFTPIVEKILLKSVNS